MVSRTSARLSASQTRIGSYASKIGFQMGSFSRPRSLANPIVGVCDVAIAPMILAMIEHLMGVKIRTEDPAVHMLILDVHSDEGGLEIFRSRGPIRIPSVRYCTVGREKDHSGTHVTGDG